MFLHHSVAFQLAHGFQASMLSAFPTQLHFKPYMDHHIYIPLRNTIFASFFFFLYILFYGRSLISYLLFLHSSYVSHLRAFQKERAAI